MFPPGSLTARLLGTILLAAGAVLMALSTSGGGASALQRTPPRAPLPAVAAPTCAAAGAAGTDLGTVLPAERCRPVASAAESESESESEAMATTSSCSTSEGEDGDGRDRQHRVPTTSSARSTGEAIAAARTTTTAMATTTATGAAGLAAEVSGLSGIPPTAALDPVATGAAPHPAVTAIPRTGAAAPFGLGLGLGLGGLSLLGLAGRRPRRGSR